MKIYCNQCSSALHPDHLYCGNCGAQTPRVTRVEGEKEHIDSPIFCVDCASPCRKDASYCTKCGSFLFARPSKETQISCPSCAAKNSSQAHACHQCTLSFDDWFAQKGTAAEMYGLPIPFTLQECMNNMTYKFLDKPSLKIGRNPDNDVVIPCSFVSRYHLEINFAKGKLRDLDSTNGTFINRSNERIHTHPLDLVDELNVSGYFTFLVIKKPGLFAINLSAILNEVECRKNGDGPAFDELRRVYLISCKIASKSDAGHDIGFNIGKTDGQFVLELRREEIYWEFDTWDKYIYFSDPSQNVPKQLIRRNNSGLPPNWKITK